MIFTKPAHRAVAGAPPGPDPDFVARIETTTPDEVFTWSFSNSGTYDAVIDYGDGSPTQTITSYNDPNRIHTYSTPGMHTVRITGTMGGIYMLSSSLDRNRIKHIDSYGIPTGSLERAMEQGDGLLSIGGGDVSLSSLRRTHYFNDLLESVVLQVGPSGSMDSTFQSCVNLATAVIGDISNVTSLHQSFYSCSAMTSCRVHGKPVGISLANNFCRGCSQLVDFIPMDLSGINMDGSYMFYGCISLTEIPVTSFWNGPGDYALSTCNAITSMLNLDLSGITSAVNMLGQNSALTQVSVLAAPNGSCDQILRICPNLTEVLASDFSNGTSFVAAFQQSPIVDFPPNAFDTCLATDFNEAFYICALSQQSVDNILVSIDTAGQSNGALRIDGGTSSAPGAAGLTAKANLEARGWNVSTN